MGLWDIDKIEYVGRGNGPVEGSASSIMTPTKWSPARR